MPKNPEIKKVLVIGSGPIVIGQAAEFDYAGTQACRSLKEEGLEVVLVNSNPATIMTDTEIADTVYPDAMHGTTTLIATTYAGEKIDVLDGIEFINGQQNDYLIKVRNTLQYHWEIDFESQASIWIQNFMSEVKFWIHDVANQEGIFRLDYNNRLFNLEFVKLDGSCASLASMLDENSIVMDIGCGLVSKYGKRLPNSKEIQLLAIDPLAAFYNIINEKYLSGRSSDKCCHFGMFEFMANFFAENYSDAIIINNALDHCIDPYKSIIECLYILKKGGIIHLNHRRAEAVFENYHGLHKWNIDYDNNNNFVIWNNENAVNVSQCLKDIADIKVTHSDDHLVRSEQFVIVDIVKLDDFNLEKFFDIKKDMHYLTSFIENLMDWIAHNVSVS